MREQGTARVALTGTPGTGKTAVAAALGPEWTHEEVAGLALRLGAGRKISGGVEVDLDRLAARVRTGPSAGLPTIVVGHLAHLLPIRDAIVLRCRPIELARRLARSRRGSAADRRANVEAEATDVVLVEALERRRRVWEIDTTRRSIASVAREVATIVRRRADPGRARVNWLADPGVTDFLLRRGP
ncbi:MAG: AAA family ATPase [Thermoplasmata archaeon]|nr:AAA family ATPase [Thermoplasmata archaeon]